MTSDLRFDRDRRHTWARIHPNRRGFSLIEMMIAIVILGLGLIMVATMFPVAWGRARRLQEFTSQVSCTSIAETTVNLQMHVDDGAGPIGFVPNDSPSDRISFAGDQILLSKRQNAFPPNAFLDADSRVHPLHMENIRVKPDEAGFVFENPYMLDPNDLLQPVLSDPEAVLPKGWKTYLEPQVLLIDRVYPPLPPRENVSDSGVFDGEDPRWRAALDTRRFCWAVFHKLDEEYVASVNNSPGSQIGKKRQFKMYYVTLRRTGATHRFARQDTELALLPDPDQRSEPANVQAFDEDEDLLFPVAWRVQILLPRDSIVFPDATTDPTGVRTEVMAGMTDAAESGTETNELVATMFRRGTQFIDEVNGRVYRVQKVRTNGNGDLAFLTLDSEILGPDVDDGEFAGNGRLESDEFLRTVWVFPPRVIGRDSSNNDQPLFAGRPPVVAIETRSLTKFP
ncbi:MAG: prepilin-type N-terminal cleavage/methylation domain-containing protein [Planctomycetes bacterium]|nr:prepilin-type N-terminal cleavage/methylation domain-containing protein [Planctomycetota bacterium]